MKKSKQETAETRRRIVKTAAVEFRRHGIANTGLSELMAAAGLTHGGFYRHFESKDQLVAEAAVCALESVAEVVRANAGRKGAKSGLEGILAGYLSAQHREDWAEGCPLAALGTELARSDTQTREAATAGILDLADIIASEFKSKPEVAQARALGMLSAMIGAITLSRIVTDPKLAGVILQQTKKLLAAV